MLYKTNLCKFYAKGTCKRGTKCSWAHGDCDIRPFPAFFKTRMCYNWIYFGTCERDPCTYAHSQVELRGSGKALRLCNYYFREGSCPKGSRCPMAHDVAQLDPSIRNNHLLAEKMTDKHTLRALLREDLKEGSLQSTSTSTVSQEGGKVIVVNTPPAAGVSISSSASSSSACSSRHQHGNNNTNNNNNTPITSNTTSTNTTTSTTPSVDIVSNQLSSGLSNARSKNANNPNILHHINYPISIESTNNSLFDWLGDRTTANSTCEDPVDELWALLKQARTNTDRLNSNLEAIPDLPIDICGAVYDPALESDATHTPSSSEDSSFFNQSVSSLDLNNNNNVINADHSINTNAMMHNNTNIKNTGPWADTGFYTENNNTSQSINNNVWHCSINPNFKETEDFMELAKLLQVDRSILNTQNF